MIGRIIFTLLTLTSSPIITLYTYICTIIFCVIFQIGFVRKAKKKMGGIPLRNFIFVHIFLIYIMLVYMLTGVGTMWDIVRHINMNTTISRLFEMPYEISLMPYYMLRDISYALNIVMTIPLGFLLPAIWSQFRSVGKVILTGLCFSILIELSQLLNLRATTLGDVFTNTLGVIIGYIMFKICFKIANRDIKRSMKSSSIVIEYEPIFYLALSFMGMFLLYNPSFII